MRAVEKRESGRTNKTEEKKGRRGGKNGRISTKPERNEKPSRANEREVSKIFARNIKILSVFFRLPEFVKGISNDVISIINSSYNIQTFVRLAQFEYPPFAPV